MRGLQDPNYTKTAKRKNTHVAGGDSNFTDRVDMLQS